MTYFQIYPISFSSVRDPQGDTFHLRVDDTFLPQATVVDLSGEAKTRPWTDRYPLAGWGILQGLADWDLCILFTADIRSEESLTESNGDQHLDPFLTDDAPEREKMECFVFSFFIISCNVCLPIWTSWTDGKCRVKMLKWDTFKGWEHKSAVHTWCWLSDLGVGGLALVRLQTSAVPDSLQGAEAGPQGRPGPARRRCCKTHEGPKFTHRHSTAHLWSVSKILILFFMHIFSLDIIQLESGFISRATFILIIFLLLRNRRFSLFHTVTQENHSSSLSHLFRPLIIQQGLSENRTQSVCSCLTKRHRQRGELYQLCAPWFWASLSSLNWVTCWWSLASFGIWKPRLASDVGDWQEEEVSDDRPGFQQEEEDASVWFPGVKSSVFSAAVLKWDGSISLAPGPLREGEAAAGVETKSCLKPEKYAPELLQPPFSVQCKLNHHGTLFCTHWLPANEP